MRLIVVETYADIYYGIPIRVIELRCCRRYRVKEGFNIIVWITRQDRDRFSEPLRVGEVVIRVVS